MIKFEHTVTPSPEQMEFVIEGMRNPLDSWEKSDSYACLMRGDGFEDIPMLRLGDNDADLMERLKNGGSEHRKFMRMMPVMVRITAPLYWWKEFDTYKIGTVRNSCSTMHTLYKKGVTPDAFSHEWIDKCEHTMVVKEPISGVMFDLWYVYKLYLDSIENLRIRFNETHDKKYWYAMIQMLPDGFMMTANVFVNYEVIFNQMQQRAHHKQEEWSGQDGYLAWAKTLPFQFLFDEKKMETFDLDKVSELIHSALQAAYHGRTSDAYKDICDAYIKIGGTLTKNEEVILRGMQISKEGTEKE